MEDQPQAWQTPQRGSARVGDSRSRCWATRCYGLPVERARCSFALYLADLANRGAQVNAALVGTLGALSFGAELLFAVPTGMLSDAIAPRALMTGGALLARLPLKCLG